MRRLAPCSLVLALWLVPVATPAAGPEPAASSVRVSPSDFRRIAIVTYPGRDLFELAIAAGIYEREDKGPLPGAERGAVSVRGRTWHGSNGVGLVAYDPHGGQYSIYYLQRRAVRGHHLDIVYSDDDFIFFSYGYHRDLPDLVPALEVYSAKRDCFARVASVSSEGGEFGYFDSEAFAAKWPEYPGPARAWDDRPWAAREWVPLTIAELTRPQLVVLRDDTLELGYHTGSGIDGFATTLRFARGDLARELDRMVACQ